MFKRPHHQAIANVLLSLDRGLLSRHLCYFGGGTAIALRYGEYRESVDMDFLVSDAQAYSELRLLARESFSQFFKTNGEELTRKSDLRVDQYGIRTRLAVGNIAIKFEIIREGRVTLETPNANDEVCEVATLTELDLVTSKLLANSDRWLDASVFSRDIIDLAMIKPNKVLLRAGIEKAEAAYGQSVQEDLQKAIDRLKTNPAILDRCMEVLAVDVPKALLWQNIKNLGRGIKSEN